MLLRSSISLQIFCLLFPSVAERIVVGVFKYNCRFASFYFKFYQCQLYVFWLYVAELYMVRCIHIPLSLYVPCCNVCFVFFFLIFNYSRHSIALSDFNVSIPAFLKLVLPWYMSPILLLVTYLYLLFKIGVLLIINFLSFCLLKKTSFLHFLMTFSLGIKFWVESLFLPALWRCYSIVSLLAPFLMRSLLLFLSLFLCATSFFFFLAAFKNFLFLFNFLHFEYYNLGMCLGWYLFCLVFSELPGSVT